MAWTSSLHFIVSLFFWKAKTANCRTQFVEGKLQWTWRLFPEIGSVLENTHWLSEKTQGFPLCFPSYFLLSQLSLDKGRGKKWPQRDQEYLWHCLMRKYWLLLNYPVNTEQTECLCSFLFGFCFEGGPSRRWKHGRWVLVYAVPDSSVTDGCCSTKRTKGMWECCPPANSTSCTLFCSACADVPLPC